MIKTTGRGLADQDIIRAIGYITNDKYIASYYGVDVRRVTHLRSQIKAHQTHLDKLAKKSADAQTGHGRPKHAYNGLHSDSERKWQAEAKAGSAALRDALFKFFEKRMLEKAALERSE